MIGIRNRKCCGGHDISGRVIGNMCCWKFVFLCFLEITVIGFFIFRSSRAFEYNTDPPDVTSFYTISSGEELVQNIYPDVDSLYGVAIQFGTFERTPKGKITVALIENHVPVLCSSLEAEYLTDNKFQEFYFQKPLRPEDDKQYGLSIRYDYSGDENAIAVYTSGGGLLESSYSGSFDSSLVYRLILVNKRLKNISILIACSLAVSLLIFTVKYRDIKKANMVKAALLAFLILAGIEAASTYLMPKIQRNIAVASPQEAHDKITIEPGEVFESSLQANYAPFNRLEIFPEEYDSVNLLITLTNKNTRDTPYNHICREDQFITDLASGQRALLLSTEKDGIMLSTGNYMLSIKNEGSKPVVFRAYESESGISLHTSLTQYTWIGYWVALGIISIIMIYLFFVFTYSKAGVSAEKFFLISAIPLALIYFVLFQANNMPDASAHFSAIYRFSNILLGYKPKDAWYIRTEDYNYFVNVWGFSTINPSMNALLGTVSGLRISNGFFVKEATMIPWPNPSSHMEFYSIVGYLPEVLGFTLARILHLGTVPMLCLGRLFMIGTYIGCMYHAIKITPVGKYAFTIVSLLPMSLMMSGAVSYDGMVILSASCFCASVLRLYKEPNSQRYLTETIIWAIVIGGVKGGSNIILLPITFILIGKKWKRTLKSVLPILLAGLCSVILFDVILPSGPLFQFGTETGDKLWAGWGLCHPIEYSRMLVKTYVARSHDLLITMGGTHLAWLEYTLPSIFIWGILFIGTCGSLFEADSLTLKKKDRNIFLFILFLALYFIPIMLLSWTNVGSPQIDGLQGRYYLPVLPLIIMILSKFATRNYVNCEYVGNAIIKTRCNHWVAGSVKVYAQI